MDLYPFRGLNRAAGVLFRSRGKIHRANEGVARSKAVRRKEGHLSDINQPPTLSLTKHGPSTARTGRLPIFAFQGDPFGSLWTNQRGSLFPRKLSPEIGPRSAPGSGLVPNRARPPPYKYTRDFVFSPHQTDPRSDQWQGKGESRGREQSAKCRCATPEPLGWIRTATTTMARRAGNPAAPRRRRRVRFSARLTTFAPAPAAGTRPCGFDSNSADPAGRSKEPSIYLRTA